MGSSGTIDSYYGIASLLDLGCYESAAWYTQSKACEDLNNIVAYNTYALSLFFLEIWPIANLLLREDSIHRNTLGEVPSP